MLVLGLDLGGTSTRAVLATFDGEIVGRGLAGGGNPVAHGADNAASQLAVALTEALSGADPVDVRHATLGMAGIGAMTDDSRSAFEAAWRRVGLVCGYDLVADPAVAFAAGTPEPDGHILIAGTGAVAASVVGNAIDRMADGHGWLLGDAGSGFWLGREAVRATLAELDRGGPVTDLAHAVVAALVEGPLPAGRPGVSAIVRAVHARPPVSLAELAPVVLSAGPELVAAAADALIETMSVVRALEDPTAIVLAGGLLCADTPLARLVVDALMRTWPAAPVTVAGDGAAAAAWLAARDLSPVDPVILHERLVGRA